MNLTASRKILKKFDKKFKFLKNPQAMIYLSTILPEIKEEKNNIIQFENLQNSDVSILLTDKNSF